MEENGVWRTVGGHRIFIKEGQDLASAMKESGKFFKKENKIKKSENQKQMEKEINDIQTRINEIEKSSDYMFGDEKLNEELDNLIEKRTKLQKNLLDEKAKNDKSMIQDKELRDYIYDYTNGDYKIACSYTQNLENGLNKKEAFEETKYYQNSGIDKISDKDFENKIRLTNELVKEIDNQKENNKLLVRFEKTQVDENYKDVSKQYKIGEEVKWGIRSTSSNENYFDKVISGKDKIEANSLTSAYPYTYTEYRIVGNKKGLDISKYSQYKDQDEVLVKGKFRVKEVEHFEPKIIYDEKPIKFNDYLKQNDYKYELRTSKSGKEMIAIYDKEGKRIYDQSVNNFTSSIDNYYSYKQKPSFKDIIEGNVSYKIEKIENKEKSIYGTKRQIVTLEQIKD